MVAAYHTARSRAGTGGRIPHGTPAEEDHCHQGATMKRLKFVAPLGALVLMAACTAGSGSAPPPTAAVATARSGSTTAPTAASPARPLQQLTVPYTPISGPMAPLWIAVEQKLFEKYGLEVTPQFIGGSSPITQAMSTGEFDIGIGNGAVAALSRLNGGD